MCWKTGLVIYLTTAALASIFLECKENLDLYLARRYFYKIRLCSITPRMQWAFARKVSLPSYDNIYRTTPNPTIIHLKFRANMKFENYNFLFEKHFRNGSLSCLSHWYVFVKTWWRVRANRSLGPVWCGGCSRNKRMEQELRHHRIMLIMDT